ncbi:phosphonate ABC transporter ATP-binding protein [Acidaminococcus fermentans]|uniref:phosphonate ABC transporter ATP-binding protein n=1 Tax=Acidaminococcus fermentans TaxID=905 RepID=UPI00242CFD51|nr:phosphonate ABC transporter ATP-binding protein [Acidaminococcus fermentans]
MKQTALELKAVSQAYEKGHPILQGVSLSVPRGAFVSLIGSSGAGKTTLLRLFNGMVRPFSGEVWVEGTRFDTLKGKQRRQVQQQVGMIFQDFCLVEESTCLENVLCGALGRVSLWRTLWGRFPGREVAKARQALEMVGLGDRADTLAGSLSGGQKQRVAIARTLVQEASVILADEPVASLDPGTGKAILELLQQLQQTQDLTVVMNSHNVEQAMAFSQQVVGLRQGKILFQGSPDTWTEEKLRALYRREP